MNKKLGKIVIALAIVLVLGIAGFGLYTTVNKAATDLKILADKTQTAPSVSDARSQFDAKLDTVLDYIDYYYYEDADMDAGYDAMLHAAVYALGDQYSTYYSPKEYQELWESSSGIYSGIGATISQNKDTLVMTVVTPFARRAERIPCHLAEYSVQSLHRPSAVWLAGRQQPRRGR